MSPDSSNVTPMPIVTPQTIAEESKKQEAISLMSMRAAAILRDMNRYNTPFDAKKRNVKRAKAKAARKANKKRKLYVRYGI